VDVDKADGNENLQDILLWNHFLCNSEARPTQELDGSMISRSTVDEPEWEGELREIVHWLHAKGIDPCPKYMQLMRSFINQ
jgi:hypothetical protein